MFNNLIHLAAFVLVDVPKVTGDIVLNVVEPVVTLVKDVVDELTDPWGML